MRGIYRERMRENKKERERERGGGEGERERERGREREGEREREWASEKRREKDDNGENKADGVAVDWGESNCRGEGCVHVNGANNWQSMFEAYLLL